jgi:hypothetical protein
MRQISLGCVATAVVLRRVPVTAPSSPIGAMGDGVEPEPRLAGRAGILEGDLAADQEPEVRGHGAGLEEHLAGCDGEALEGAHQLGEVVVRDAGEEGDRTKIGRTDRHG